MPFRFIPFLKLITIFTFLSFVAVHSEETNKGKQQKVLKWENLPKTELRGRSGHNYIVYNDKLIIWGGCSMVKDKDDEEWLIPESLSDGEIFDLKEMKWEKLPKAELKARSGNTCILYNDKLIIWGGLGSTQNETEFFSDGAMLDLKEMKWKTLPETEVEGRTGHTSLLYNDKLIIWGGNGFDGDLSDGAILDLKALTAEETNKN